MSRELLPESNISDLVDYLLEMGVDIHMLVPDDRVPSLQIRVDCEDTHGRLIRCVKCIDMIRYKSATPELRNMVVTRTISELIKELARFK